MVLMTSTTFHALEIAEDFPFGKQGQLGASTNGLSGGPKPPNGKKRGQGLKHFREARRSGWHIAK